MEWNRVRRIEAMGGWDEVRTGEVVAETGRWHRRSRTADRTRAGLWMRSGRPCRLIAGRDERGFVDEELPCLQPDRGRARCVKLWIQRLHRRSRIADETRAKQ